MHEPCPPKRPSSDDLRPRPGRLALVCTALVLAIGARASAAPAPPLTLVQDGRSAATIVLAAGPTTAAQLGALELQYYVQKISGARLPIVHEPAEVQGTRILVGAGRAAEALGFQADAFGEQEYVIRTSPDALLLMGRDAPNFDTIRYDDYSNLYHALTGPLATCYAVHAFLEKVLGVRWYYPNEAIGEVVPAAATVTVPALDIRRRPDVPIRHIYPLFANTRTLYFTDWDQREKFQTTMVDPRLSLLYWIRNRLWGSMRYNANHSFHGYDTVFGESHPEWFSTKSYERMKQLRYQSDVQPCLTAPGFFEQVVQIARDYYDGKKPVHPDVLRATGGRFFPVVMNDNTNMCGCATCSARYRADVGPGGNASHYVWGFANRVARAVRQTHPEAMISGLGYFNYTLPPKGLVFEPNVAVTFCKFYQAYSDPAYQERDYVRIGQFVHENGAQFFTTWEYLCHPFVSEWPFPCMVPHEHAEDVRRLSAIGGFKGGNLEYTYFRTHSGTRPAGYAWASPVWDFMNLYWRMKLYDDVSLDIDAALDEYYQTFFGPGAAGMKRFYTAIEDRWMQHGGGGSARAWWGTLGTRPFLDELAGHVEQARSATDGDSLYRRRVDLIDAGILQYLYKARARYETSAMAEFAPVATAAVARVDGSRTGADWFDDLTWADALPNVISRTLRNEAVSQRTVFHLAHDAAHLYIRARCDEADVAAIKAATRGDDVGGFSDDSLELFVDPTGTGRPYYQFCINSRGAVYDAREDPSAPGATATVTWDAGMKVKAAVGADHWELRMALPFAGLADAAPKAGQTWRLNLCRNRWAEPDAPPYSAWSPTLGGFRNPERFGVITFNAPEDRGRLAWQCDFEGGAFASSTGASPLFGLDGWYENTNYADRGWAKSWQVVRDGAGRVAACDVNATNPSDLMPFHTVSVFPGRVSVEAMFRRDGVDGNMPTLQVQDTQARRVACLYAWEGRADLLALEQEPDRNVYAPDAHGLGELAGPGRWFGLKVVIDMAQKNVTAFARRGSESWVRLNDQPIAYLDPEAGGPDLCIGLGTRKHGMAEGNVVAMDDVRVVQVSVAGEAQ